jgi:hypothetical protein
MEVTMVVSNVGMVKIASALIDFARLSYEGDERIKKLHKKFLEIEEAVAYEQGLLEFDDISSIPDDARLGPKSLALLQSFVESLPRRKVDTKLPRKAVAKKATLAHRTNRRTAS